ncbi:hypothetical protein Dda_6633 [Drechslerella dactyloides]|uniref:Uncharacterized protein n=1 Tax=Drechslerella dactyloides TaxID=74499 RepID=A0AAD6IUH2_DREDA|nr:hypothetical protein Dda_6633 [Drechslerella dactyloides]
MFARPTAYPISQAALLLPPDGVREARRQIKIAAGEPGRQAIRSPAPSSLACVSYPIVRRCGFEEEAI